MPSQGRRSPPPAGLRSGRGCQSEARRDETAHWLHERGQDQAAETLYRDWDDFTTFYDFPAEHHLHLRTSNAIESVFAGVRLRTNVAKRARVHQNALYLVFKIVERLGRHWRVLNGGATVMTLVLAGERFVDGVLVKQPPGEEEEGPDHVKPEGSFHAT